MLTQKVISRGTTDKNDAFASFLGSAIYLGASILTFFEQIGILEEFLSHGKPTMTASMYNEKRELQNEIDFSFLKELYVRSAVAPSCVKYNVPRSKLNLRPSTCICFV